MPGIGVTEAGATRTGREPHAADVAASEHDVVAVAASLGGIPALSRLLAALPADFPLPILVVQHLLRERPSLLPQILARRTALHVKPAAEGDCPAPGWVYVAPPDRHLVVRPGGKLGLSSTAPVNFCRPSADVLFRSLAQVHGSRAIAAVLTGLGRDGARGMEAVAAAGGTTIAQDEAEAAAPDMPRAAVDIGHAELVLPLDRMAFALQVLAGAESASRSERSPPPAANSIFPDRHIPRPGHIGPAASA